MESSVMEHSPPEADAVPGRYFVDNDLLAQ